MSRYLVPVLALCILSSLAVVMLSPSPAEELELSLGARSAPEALAALNRVYAEGGRDPNLLLKRADLSLEAGDLAGARETLESLAELPPHALLAEERLAQAARELGDLDTAATHLAKAYELAPSSTRLIALATSLRLLRRLHEEEQLLLSLDPAQLPDQLAMRLLELQRTRGNLQASEGLLRARIGLPPKQRGDARTMLASLLIGSGRANEAAIMAAEWYSADGDTDSLTRVMTDLLSRGFVREARALATACLESGRDGAHVTISVFAVAGHGTIARALLGDWLGGRTTLTAAEQAALLSYMRTMNDFSAALTLIRRSGAEAFEPSFVLGAVKGAYRRFGGAAVNALLPDLKSDILKTDPLFAAELSLTYGQYVAAARYLASAAAKGLEPGEQQAFVELAHHLESVAPQLQVTQRLARLRESLL